MNFDHWILVGAWLLFGLVHSLMAAGWFRSICRSVMGRYFIYYRLLYSILATLSLAAVLAWQFSVKSVTVAPFPILKWLIGLPVGELGLFLMGNSIRKYFFNLSGVSVFWKIKERRLPGSKEGGLPESEKGGVLESGGIHRYVRHPLYLGTLLFIWSLFLFFPLLSNLLACGMITLYTLVGIQLEEKKLLQQFGKSYADYRSKVPMLIPGTKIGRAPSRQRPDLRR